MKVFVKLLCFLYLFYSSKAYVQTLICPSYPKLNALPGNGWCSLRNIEMNPVFAVTYNKCQVLETPTGKYLIPDYLHITPKSTSDIGTSHELIHSYQNFTSSTARSMSASASGGCGKFTAQGSFSFEYQNMKKNQVINKSVTSRISGRYVLHAARFDEYAVELHPDLKVKLLDAIEAITDGHLTKASLILELAILSHGTHAITGIDIGGVIVKEDYISENYINGNDMNSLAIHASASIGFAQFFSAACSFNKIDYESKYNEYVKNTMTTKISSHGGMLFDSATLNISKWIDSLPYYLVAVDQWGAVLPNVITQRHFPGTPENILAALRREYVEAIEHFNEANIHVGCMNQSAPNFDYNANIGSKSCDQPPTNYTFGGLFQTCYCNDFQACSQCKDLVVKNYATGDTSCPDMFTSVYLNGKSLQQCWRKCQSNWFSWHCEMKCIHWEYRAYWCAADHHSIPKNTGVMFGGVFTSTSKNPLTDSKSCPPYFWNVSILQDLTVCMSDDYEFGYKYSVPFGGFFSCNEGNPLAAVSSLSNENRTTLIQTATTKYTCGDGYSQHLAAIDNDCSIHYCVKANSFGSGQKEMPIQLPPFQNYDEMFAEQATVNTIPIIHESSTVITVLGSLLGLVLSAIVCYVGFKIFRRRRFSAVEIYRNPLISNDSREGYQSLTGNEAEA